MGNQGVDFKKTDARGSNDEILIGMDGIRFSVGAIKGGVQSKTKKPQTKQKLNSKKEQEETQPQITSKQGPLEDLTGRQSKKRGLERESQEIPYDQLFSLGNTRPPSLSKFFPSKRVHAPMPRENREDYPNRDKAELTKPS